MRSFEYIYLAAAVGLLVFLALSWKEMPTGPRIGLMAGIVIATFMYSFRRTIRLKIEQEDREMESTNQEEEEEESNA